VPRFSSFTLLLGPAAFVAAALAPAQKPDPEYSTDILPLLTKYCGACHANKDNADMTLTTLQTPESFRSQRDKWQRIEKNLSNRHMPPGGMPTPTDTERGKLVDFIQRALDPGNGNTKIQNPGRVTIRRLNREEYNNTIRDLFGIQLRPAAEFPSDDVGYGFDNIGDVLSMSPLLMEKYLAAAQEVAQRFSFRPRANTR
jgi:hypothetical protein